MTKRKTALEIQEEQRKAAAGVRRKVTPDSPLNSDEDRKKLEEESKVVEVPEQKELSTKEMKKELYSATSKKSSLYFPEGIIQVLKMKALEKGLKGYNEILRSLVLEDLTPEEIKKAYEFENNI